MPDQDLFDLESAFTRLERDIAGVSSPRGAGLAVSTARRRRRTTIASVAAVAVLAVAGVAISQGAGRHDSGIGPSGSPLPDPTPLTVQAFNSATDGWVSGWGHPTANSPQGHLLKHFTCLDDGVGQNSPLNQADKTGGAFYVAGSTALVDVLALEFTQGGLEAAAQAVTRGAEACNPFGITSTTYADGSSVTYYDLPGKGASPYFQLFVARYGDRLGLAVIGGAQDIPSSDTVTRVDDLMLGILQVASTFTSVPAGDITSSSSSSASISEAQKISDGDFSAALGSWPTQWQRRGTKVDTSALPCAGDWTTGSSSGLGASLGANGDQEVSSFDSADHAASSADTLAANLRACTSAPYAVSSSPAPGGGTVTVAVGSAASDRVVWIVQKGAEVAYVSIPGDTAPPHAVTQAVAGLIVDALDHATQGPPPVESSAPVQQQSGKNTSSSSSSAAAPQG